MKFTIFGGTGFIGRHLARHLASKGHEIYVPARGEDVLGKRLSHVIYAIGLTGDFIKRPYDTVDAHVNILCKLIQTTKFDSWLYLSSTRIYGGLPDGTVASEDARLTVFPSADNIYNISKLLGETICLQHGNPAVRVARLSNVYSRDQGVHSFLGKMMMELGAGREMTVAESPQSSKDYIAVEDAVKLLESIALRGNERMYNVASGTATQHGAIADRLKSMGYEIKFGKDVPTRTFPCIDVKKITQEFRFSPRRLIDDLPVLFSKAV
jgi:nucleoside-diphosphate-sugar epimerase